MKKIECFKYDCYITADEDGQVTAWRSARKNGVMQPLQKPRRVRKGQVTYLSAGFVSVENPPADKGHWEGVGYYFDYRFIKNATKYFDGTINWKDEPKRCKMMFVFELED